MAAGKNDVIKLLPPLTLSEAEARELPRRARRGARRLPRRREQELGRSCATSPPRRCAAAGHAASRRRAGDGAVARHADRRRRATTSAWSPARPASSAATSRERLRARGLPGPLPGAREQRHVAAGHARRRDRRRRPDQRRARSRAPPRAAATCFHCGALVSDWATAAGDRARSTSRARATCSTPAVGASVQRFVHFSTTDVYGYPGGAGVDETHAATRFRNWYAQTKLAAEAEVRRAERGARARRRDPAPGDRLRAALDRRRRRDRAGDRAAATCC